MSTIDTKKYQGRKVAVVGYGIEGDSALRYYQARGAIVTVVDEAEQLKRAVPEGVQTILGPSALDQLQHFDIVSRTPPLAPKKITTFGQVTSVTREFFAECPASIIGVTGTKGKGTTTTLISEILKAAGKTTHLVGNIGSPALDSLELIGPDDIVCYEMSSFQLWDVDVSPETAVVLMVEPDHLDIHEDFNEYLEAKKGIGRYQQKGDVIISHPSNPRTAKIVSASPAQKLHYLDETGAHIRGGDIYIDEHKICSTAEVGLRGEHNLENVCAAITAAWRYTQNVSVIAETVKKFTGLEHRLELVRELDGVRYYNDSYSSAVIACRAAIKAFPDDTLVVILGGKDKKNDYGPALEALLEADVRRAILYGENKLLLAEDLKQRGYTAIDLVDGDLTDVIAAAKAAALDGDVVVFSPGTSSYDMFDNFKHRGETFKAEVAKLQ